MSTEWLSANTPQTVSQWSRRLQGWHPNYNWGSHFYSTLWHKLKQDLPSDLNAPRGSGQHGPTRAMSRLQRFKKDPAEWGVLITVSMVL